MARTVEEPQPDFEDFLLNTGRALGQLASINTITSTRLTILESGNIKRHLRLSRSNGGVESRELAFRLASELDDSRHNPILVEVAEDDPVMILGSNSDAVALRINLSDTLEEERQKTEDRLEVELKHSQKLKLRPFEPHITIGRLKNGSGVDERELKSSIESIVAFPREVALNGLQVILGG